jgi:hypothetical protein
MHEHVGAHEVVATDLLQLDKHPIARGKRFRLDNDLPKERVGKLLIERQIEADRALADVGAP